jgi:type II secretory ATPase GspE/PulE/Tfp pilus assembly ATPase PilB-like protein
MESLVKKGTVGEVLYNSKIITENDIRLALEEQRLSGCRFGEALVKLGIVDQEDLDWALSNQLDIPYIRLSKENIDQSAIKLVSGNLARRYNLIPVILAGDELHIAIADPLDRKAIEEVEKFTGFRVTVSMPVIRELKEMLDHFYGPDVKEFSFGFSSASVSEEIIGKINSDISGASMLEYLILFFLQSNIDSIALQPIGRNVRVSTRSGGTFREIGRFPLSSYPGLLSNIKNLIRIDCSSDLSSDGKVLYRFHDIDLALRVSKIAAKDGECVTIKLWSNHDFPASADELELDRDASSNFHSLTRIERGMILFSSWDRLERSRLIDLYLDEAATDGKNVLLLGEGIGRGAKGFPCIPLGDCLQKDMESLMTLLDDHDPDLIVIEDVTDSRSFHAAWMTAMRNRAVVAGISCGGLAGAVDYLISERRFNHSVMVGVRGIVSLSGIRTLCPHCRESKAVSGMDMDLPLSDLYYRGKGCSACGFSGLNGMKYLVEALTVDARFREAFDSARDSSEFLKRLSGNVSNNIDDHLRTLLRNGDISPEEFAAASAKF